MTNKHECIRASIGRFVKNAVAGLLELDQKLLEAIAPTTIPQDWIRGDYLDVFEALNPFASQAKIFLADRYYYFCDVQVIRDFLAKDATDRETYVTETHDCDDFSFRLMGEFHVKPYSALAFGIAWSEVHAFNLFIDDKGSLWCIEPQNDLVRRYGELQNDATYRNLQFVTMCYSKAKELR